jgi:hypothetical protein
MAENTPDQPSDVAVAVALAQAIRSLPYVVDLSAGRFGVAVTYGPGQRIAGIVLRRPIPMEDTEDDARPASVVETHIVLAAAIARAFPEQRLSSGQSQRAVARAERPVLLKIADEIRQTLEREIRRLRPTESWVIDIAIDDLREAEQPPTYQRIRYTSGRSIWERRETICPALIPHDG